MTITVTMAKLSRRRPRRNTDAAESAVPAAGPVKGSAKYNVLQRPEEEEQEADGSQSQFLFEIFVFPTVMVLLLVGFASVAKRQSTHHDRLPSVRDIMVLGSMSSGSRSLASELRCSFMLELDP